MAVPRSRLALRFDIMGLVAAAVVLPKAMAYATVAGLPVSVGLYTAFVPMIIYALLGTSRVAKHSVRLPPLPFWPGPKLGTAVPDGDPGKLVTAVATLVALTGAPPHLQHSVLPPGDLWPTSFHRQC